MPELCRTAATRAAQSIASSRVGVAFASGSFRRRSRKSREIRGTPGMASSKVSRNASTNPSDLGTVNGRPFPRRTCSRSSATPTAATAPRSSAAIFPKTVSSGASSARPRALQRIAENTVVLARVVSHFHSTLDWGEGPPVRRPKCLAEDLEHSARIRGPDEGREVGVDRKERNGHRERLQHRHHLIRWLECGHLRGRLRTRRARVS